MKKLMTLGIALAAISAGAQTTNFSQMQHIDTALNHLTVIDFGESIVESAIADKNSFFVEQREDKLLLSPLKEGVSTNLIVWTSSRELVYEINPAGDVAKMNVLIRNLPPAAHPTAASAVSPQPTDQEIQKIASLVLTQALLGTENIVLDDQKERAGEIFVRLEDVFRGKDELYIRYSVLNLSKAPFRVTSPDVYEPSPTQAPISMSGLRNHQLSAQSFGTFKTKRGPTVSVTRSEVKTHDLAPGERTTGVICIRNSTSNPPHLFQLDFGRSADHSITVEAVL